MTIIAGWNKVLCTFLFLSYLAAQSGVLDKTISLVMKNELPVKKVLTVLVSGEVLLNVFSLLAQEVLQAAERVTQKAGKALPLQLRC